VLTDYPDQALVVNLWHNVSSNIPTDIVAKVDVQGYIWGQPIGPLLQELPPVSAGPKGFDLIILSDLIFNHSQVSPFIATYSVITSINTNIISARCTAQHLRKRPPVRFTELGLDLDLATAPGARLLHAPPAPLRRPGHGFLHQGPGEGVDMRRDRDGKVPAHVPRGLGCGGGPGDGAWVEAYEMIDDRMSWAYQYHYMSQYSICDRL
jgi:hypothetical protein